LPEQRRLLIAGDSHDREGSPEERSNRPPEISGRRPDLGENLDRYVKEVAQLLGPAKLVYVE
jgi:hypothetical protein